MRKNYILLGVVAIGLSGFAMHAQKPTKFIDRGNMNLQVKPGDDFS